jgi:bacteriocin biosynthesis cyclodehydratase domain-containing protein
MTAPPSDSRAVPPATARPTLLRPILLPGLCRLWRDRQTLQLGLDPAKALVLRLGNPAAAQLLDLLDGRHTERSVLHFASRTGIDDGDARSLLDTLQAAGLLISAQSLLPGRLSEQLLPEAVAVTLTAPPPATSAQILRRRATAKVLVTGRGRLASTIALALAHAGIGHVAPALDGHVIPGELIAGGLVASDVGEPRGEAVAAAIERASPGTVTRAMRRGEPTFLVQVGAACTGGPAALSAMAYAQRRLAHLAAAIRDGTGVIGPLVPPAGSPCLNCLDLHRTDRDPAWPAIAAQLASQARQPAEPTEPCAATTLLAVAAFAAAEVLAFTDGGSPQTIGATIEITAPGQHRRRTWPPHPTCGCARQSRRRSTQAGSA